MNYKHTQIGHLILGTTLAIIILFTLILLQTMFILPIALIMIFVVTLLASFSTLTVRVDKEYIQIKFGYGIFRKRFARKEIVSAKIVRNKWYYGWGIRLWLWPKMWIFNISGFNAVELRMKNGAVYRIGTNEPKKLVKNIK